MDRPDGNRADEKPATGDRRFLPPLKIWGLFLTFCGLVIWVRVTASIGDNAVENILTLVFSFLALVTIGTWLLFFSAYSNRVRAVIGLAGLTCVVAFFARYRIDHVNGEMIPTFRARNAPAADELLSAPTTAATKSADLSTSGLDDFPQFLGPQRSGQINGQAIETDWQAHPPTKVWKQPIGAGWSSFVAVNGFAVTMEQRGDDELVTCYEVASGDLIWAYGHASRYSTVLGGVGPRSTPTISGGKVYAVGALGHVVCLNGSTGAVIWQDNLLERYGVTEDEELSNVIYGRSGSPLVVDDLVVVPAGGSANGKQRSLIAYRKESGEVAWESGDRQIGFCSPILATICDVRQVVTISEDSISGHRPDNGEVLWEHPWPGSNTTAPNVAQPIVLPGDRLFTSKGYRAGAILLQLSATDGRFGVQEVWRNRRLLRTKFTNPVVHEDHIYGLSDGILESVNWKTARRAWKRGRYYHGQILAIDDLLLVQAENGDIALVEASPAGWRELSRFNAISENMATNPCLHGRYLLVRNSTEAACYEIVTQRGLAATKEMELTNGNR